MLVEFTISNFKSFRDQTTFSLMASDLDEHQKHHLFTGKQFHLLQSAFIFGTNGAGKSTLFQALRWLSNHLLTPLSSEDYTPPVPFGRDLVHRHKPSFFEIIIFIYGKKYRYGLDGNKDGIQTEWLFETYKGKEKERFIREGNILEINESFVEAKELDKYLHPKKSFLSVIAHYDGETAKSILEWFKKIAWLDRKTNLKEVTPWLKIVQNKTIKKQLELLVRNSDLDIIDIEFRPTSNDIIPFEIFTAYPVYDKSHKEKERLAVPLREESEGIQMLLHTIGFILYHINKGHLIIADGFFDGVLHPFLLREVIGLLHNKKVNARGGQLLFNSFYHYLINPDIFRRDQIYFIEKNPDGFSILYDLSKFDWPKDLETSWDKLYLEGRLGAFPHIKNWKKILDRT